MSSNGIDTSTAGRRWMLVSRWVVRLLIALIVSVLLVLIFFTSGAISH